MNVPSVLLSGNHKEIKKWRYDQKVKRTFERRKDYIFREGFEHLNENKKIFEDNEKLMTFILKDENEMYPDW